MSTNTKPGDPPFNAATKHRPPPTQAEIDHLFHLFKDHLETCGDFDPMDVNALAEVAKMWKIVQGIRRVGAWFWALVIKLGGAVIRAGAVLTACIYLYQQLKGGPP